MKRLFQPPQLQSEKLGTQERHATWLELFYDLAYVAAIAVLADRLAHHLTPWGLLEFIVLFIPIWHLWVGATFYADRFDTDDLMHQLLTLVQMVGIVGLAIFCHQGLVDGFEGYVVSYAIVQGALIVMNKDAGQNNKVAWDLTNRYALGFGIGLLFWLGALLAPAPLRYYLVGIGFVIDYITPFTISGHDVDLPVHVSHLPERFGLFSIIALGEIIAAIVKAGTHGTPSNITLTVSILALLLTFCVWWMYFQNINAQSLLKKAYHVKKTVNRWRRREYRHSVMFVQAHMPLTIAIALIAVGTEHVIAEHAHPNILGMLLLVGGVNTCLIVIGILEWMTYNEDHLLLDKVRMWLRLGAAGVVLLLTLTSLIQHPLLLFTAITIVVVGQLMIELFYRYYIFQTRHKEEF